MSDIYSAVCDIARGEGAGGFIKLKRSDLRRFDEMLIEGLWNDRLRSMIDGISAAFNAENITGNGEVPVRVKYYFIKLFKINDLARGGLLEDGFREISGGPRFVNGYRTALWYLLRRAALREIDAFAEFIGRPGRRRDAVRMLADESAGAFAAAFGGCLNRIALEKLKFFYRDLAESSAGQKRRDAEFNYYVLDEYIGMAPTRWAFLAPDASDKVLLYDALKFRFEAAAEEQATNAGLIKISGVSPAGAMSMAAACFSRAFMEEFDSVFSDAAAVADIFRRALGSKSGEVFNRYSDEIGFERFAGQLRAAAARTSYKFVESCSSELNAAECRAGGELISEIMGRCFSGAAARAAQMLEEEISRWIDERVVNCQISDAGVAVVNKLVIFEGGMARREEIVGDDRIAGLASRHGSLHLVFSCLVDRGGKRVRELCRTITPTRDDANGRVILHSDFAPLEVPYARGVILSDGSFEYDRFNTWFGGRDRIHRSEVGNPYTAAIISRMAEGLAGILRPLNNK